MPALVRTVRRLGFGALLALSACKFAPSVEATRPPVPVTRAPREVELSEAGLKNAEVRTAPATRGNFSPHLVATAGIVADPQAMARVGARMAGRVAAIRVRVGDVVQVDQPLVDIDTVELHHVSTEYLTALARAHEANDVLTRQKQLVQERVGAVQELRRAEAAARVADATLHETEEHLHFLGLDDNSVATLRGEQAGDALRSILRAPIAGRIETVSVSLGQVLTGTEDVLTLMQRDHVWAVLRVYEHDVGSVDPNAAVDVATVGYPDRVFHGRVDAIGDLVDPTTRTVEVRVAIDNRDGALKPGMSATATVSLQSTDLTLWLPRDAIQQGESGQVVFVKTGERRFAARPVRIEAERNGFVKVVSGLREGEDVVVQGGFTLRGELERAELGED